MTDVVQQQDSRTP